MSYQWLGCQVLSERTLKSGCPSVPFLPLLETVLYVVYNPRNEQEEPQLLIFDSIT